MYIYVPIIISILVEPAAPMKYPYLTRSVHQCLQQWLDSIKKHFSWNVHVTTQSSSWGSGDPGHHADMVTAEPSSSLQWPSVSQPAQHKEDQMSHRKVTTNAWESSWMCFSAPQWLQLRRCSGAPVGLIWGQVQTAPCHVMWSAFMLTDDRCPWSWRVFALSPHWAQEQHTYSRVSLN